MNKLCFVLLAGLAVSGCDRSAEVGVATSDSAVSSVEILEEKLQDAVDNEDIAAVRRFAANVQERPVEVRRAVLEALEWFGGKAVNEISLFLKDKDEELREEALMAVDSALCDIEDERQKVKLIESLAKDLSGLGEEGLSVLESNLTSFDDGALAVGAAVRLLKANPDAALVAILKSVCSDIIGEDYTTVEAAEKWAAELADPKTATMTVAKDGSEVTLRLGAGAM